MTEIVFCEFPHKRMVREKLSKIIVVCPSCKQNVPLSLFLSEYNTKKSRIFIGVCMDCLMKRLNYYIEIENIAKQQNTGTSTYKRFKNIRVYIADLVNYDIDFSDSNHKTDKLPMSITETYWIHAKLRKTDYPDSYNDGGKWLVFINKTEINDWWIKILAVFNKDKLGRYIKCSTALENPNSNNKDDGVICVYTYDIHDEIDIKTIRDELRNIGITWKIPYKADADIGKYIKNGYRTSLYYE